MKKTLIVPFADVVADPNNPRQEFDPVELNKLEASVKKEGILTPLQVEEKDGKYQIVDGERRYRVAKRLHLKELPVIVMEAMTDVERLVKRFHLQEQHSQWTAWEKAHAVNQFIEITGLPPAEVASSLGIALTNITKYAFITGLTKRTAQKIIDRKLPWEWMVEIGRSIKAIENYAELREELENALLDKIDRKIVMQAKEIKKYRMSIILGGKKILDKVIKISNYSPTQASLDSGNNVNEDIKNVSVGISHIIWAGERLLNYKHFVGTESSHNNFVRAKKILDKLVDLDYEAGTKRRRTKAEI